MPRFALLLAALCAARAAESPDEAPGRPVRTTRLVGPYGDVAGALRAPFARPFAVRISAPGPARTLRSCAEYLGVAAQDPDAVDPREHASLLTAGAHCRALSWLREARPARASFLDGFALDERAPDLLPADLHPALAVGQVVKAHAAAPARTWRSLDPRLRAELGPGGELRVHGRGYQARVYEYARGDFDRDGLEDLLLRRDGVLGAGEAHDVAVFVLTRAGPRDPLRVLRRESYGP
jgi:hypothetical protein